MTKNGGNKDQAMYVQLKVKLQSLTTIYFSTFTMSNCAFLLNLSVNWLCNFYVNVPRESDLSQGHLHVATEAMTYGAFMKIIR